MHCIHSAAGCSRACSKFGLMHCNHGADRGELLVEVLVGMCAVDACMRLSAGACYVQQVYQFEGIEQDWLSLSDSCPTC